MLTNKNAQAFGVLAAIKVLDNDLDYSVGFYRNGREEGFCVTNYERLKNVAFAENRNSDDIVVYVGALSDFDISSGIPTEPTYQRARYFKPLDYRGAAEYVLEHLFGKEKT